ncbi:hemerythrin domain-containing protein [soil metagenome]
MKATTLLIRQHNKSLAALKKLAAGHGTKAILDEVTTDLVAHMIIEETICYPAVREMKKDLILEAYEEHAIAQLSIKRLVATPLDSDQFEARATTLKELIQHHVDEEQDELFPKVEKALGDDGLEALGASMKAKFDEMVPRGWAELLPQGAGKTTSDASSSAKAKKPKNQSAAVAS